MYDGFIKWQEEFEGEVSDNVYGSTSDDPYELWDRLTSQVEKGKVISIEIKWVDN